MSSPFVFRFVSFVALGFGLVSIVHFLSLAAGTHFWVDASIAILGCVVLGVWLLRGNEKDTNSPLALLLILPTGLLLLFVNSFSEMEKWGGWDAWAIWNHRASLLESADYWQRALVPHGNEHPDYPLCLPAGIAFFDRLLPGLEGGSAAVAAAWGATLAIVLLLFGTLQKRSILIATGVLLFLATDKAFLKNGLAQYADVLLALFLLIAYVACRYIKIDKRAATICGAAIGLCPWTKNEGAILAVLALFFLGKEMVSTKAWKPFLAGLVVPLSVWLFFKISYAPEGDMLSNNGVVNWLEKLGQGERYKILWKVLRDTVVQSYGIPALLLLAYVLIRYKKRRWPAANFLLICTGLLVYCSIYLVTPYDPEWHLITSLPRLLHQLMPAALFICATELSQLRIQFSEEHPD